MDHADFPLVFGTHLYIHIHFSPNLMNFDSHIHSNPNRHLSKSKHLQIYCVLISNYFVISPLEWDKLVSYLFLCVTCVFMLACLIWPIADRLLSIRDGMFVVVRLACSSDSAESTVGDCRSQIYRLVIAEIRYIVYSFSLPFYFIAYLLCLNLILDPQKK
jgi:hypothetical protein